MKRSIRSVLLISDDNNLAFEIAQWLEARDIPMEMAAQSEEVLVWLKNRQPQDPPPRLVLIDRAIDTDFEKIRPCLTEAFSREPQAPAYAFIGKKASPEEKSPPEARGGSEDLPEQTLLLSRPLTEEGFIEKAGPLLGLAQEDEDHTHRPPFNKSLAMTIIGNDPSILQIGLETFIEDTPATFTALIDSIDTNNFLKARQYCHALEGASSTIAAEALDGMLKKLHRHLRVEDAEASREMIPALQEGYGKLQGILQKELENLA